MSNGQVSKGRLIQHKMGYKVDGIPNLENAEFGLVLDENQEELYIGSNTGNIQVVTERNIGQLAVQDGSIGRTKLDGEVNALLDNISSVTNIPEATTSQKGLMSSNDKVKLNSIETGANNTTIINSLTSLSTSSALSAYQGKLLKDMIDTVGSGGSTVAVVNNLTSTDTSSALSANQGKVLKGLIDAKADTTTATTSKNGLMSASDKRKLDSLSNTTITVTNSLTSASTTSALSANMGNTLNNNLTALDERFTKYLDEAVVKTTADLTFYVSESGSDNNDGLTSNTSFRTIQKAIDMIPQIVNHNVTINVSTGNYDEIPNFNKGFDGAGTINLLGAESLARTHKVKAISANRVNLPLILRGFECIDSNFTGVTSRYCKHVGVHYFNITVPSVLDGVLFDVSKGRVYGCEISNRAVGIYSTINSSVISDNNIGVNNKFGIGATSSVLRKNSTQPSGTSMEFESIGGQIL